MGYNQLMDMLFRGNPELCCKHCGRYLGTWRLFKAGLTHKILRHGETYPVKCRYCKKQNIVDREQGKENFVSPWRDQDISILPKRKKK